MVLEDLIEELEKANPDIVCKVGFNNPHSYRGYYDQLAFEPVEDITVGEMLEAAKEALGSTYTGWKGGEYTMSEYTDCHLANRGNTGEELGATLLKLMILTRGEP